MQLLSRASLLAVLFATVGGNLAYAEVKGKGSGLARALSKAGGKGGSSAGLSRASQNLSRAGSSLGRSGFGTSGMMKSSPLQSVGSRQSPAGASSRPVPGAADATAQHEQQLVIEQRNRDQRLAQAQHLRDLATKNDNAELAANADRMASFAKQHYEERIAQLGRFGVTNPTLALPNAPLPESQLPPAPVVGPQLPPGTP